MAFLDDLFPDDFHLFSPYGIALGFSVFLSLVIIYTLTTAIYNIYFHPLSHIPGPLYASASGIPYTLHIRRGTMVQYIQSLHTKYGDCVRVAPSEVSFISGETAWQDIYGFRTGKHRTPPYLKDRTWYTKPFNGTYSIIGADEEAHSKYRRALSHAFSEKALREQEGLVTGFVDLLVSRLEEFVGKKAGVDIMRWYNYTTFDIIADLTFGEPLYCLRDKDYHPWVTMVFHSVKAIGFLATRRKYPLFAYYDRLTIFLNSYLSPSTTDVVKTRRDFADLTSHKVTTRLQNDTPRPDFMSHILKHGGVLQEGSSTADAKRAMNKDEIDSNMVLFLIAGSETTATLLSGATYLLLKPGNERVYKKLVDEIRSSFKSSGEITLERVNNMPYLLACLQEALRYYPPVPTGFPRVVPKGGDTISGHYIPEGTSLYVSQHATNHSPRNYTDPDSYIPERWIPIPPSDPSYPSYAKYENDNRAATQPFSFGPRNCLGKNLAYFEMRLILAKVLFAFDLELVEKEKDWMGNQKVFVLWEKPALQVRLTPVKREE